MRKAAWVGRTASTVFGLALVLALIFGVATTALGTDGNPFLLGKKNIASAVSTLVNEGPGPALHLVVQAGQPPLKVNSSAKVIGLNADEVDGKDHRRLVLAGRDKLPGGQLSREAPYLAPFACHARSVIRRGSSKSSHR
jgi:hypothetical protein